MYCVKADDFHIPSFWINEPLKPAAAAVDAETVAWDAGDINPHLWKGIS